METKIKDKVFCTVSAPIEITEQNVADMLCSAFEGGINYWCSEAKAIEGKSKGFLSDAFAFGDVTKIEVTVPEEEDDDGNLKLRLLKYTVTRDDLIKAFQIMADDYARHFADFRNGNSDADTADVWFQCAVFGESIYG